ncbi:unnamed protein product [Durusdinium trenchii]|uniref:Hexosyltransferase n=1 Tax=Durusdinium trenchii TaxID=1381693 RepID=A0ABP0IBF8_9DINO
MRWLLACLLALVPAQETGLEPDGAVQLQLHRVRDDYVDLLIVVPSEAKEVQERRLIRDSWGKYLADGHCKVCGSNRRVKLLFGLGARTNQSLQEEKDWADVAVLSLDSKLDSPNQQAMKTRILIAHAVEKYDFGLLLKVDPHSFVFLDRLLSLAEGKKLFPSDETPDIYGGYFAYQDKQVKKMEGKLKDLDYRKLTGHNRFPKYAKGAGYLLSRRLCRCLVPESMSCLIGLPCQLYAACPTRTCQSASGCSPFHTGTCSCLWRQLRSAVRRRRRSSTTRCRRRR